MDIQFKSFDLDKRLKEENSNASFYKVPRRSKIISFIVLFVKKILFHINHKKIITNQIKNCDSVFIGGGNLLMEYNGGDLFYRTLKISEIAKSLNKKVIIYGVGLGPFEFSYKKRLIRLINTVDKFYVRDENNKHICNQFKENLNKEIKVVLDPAFIVSDIQIKKNIDVKYIGFNFMNYSKIVNNSNFDVDKIVTNIKIIHEYYKLPIKIINTTYGEDLSIATIIRDKAIRLNIDLINFNIKHVEDLPIAFSDLSFFFASRMHSSIFAMSYNIPTLIYPWHPKVQYLQELLFNKQHKWTLLKSENFNPGEIIEKINNYGKLNLCEVVRRHKINIYNDYREIINSL